MFIAMACPCVLLGGPSYAAGADSLFIAGATYYEPGASGPGWAWTDADRLELNGYTGEAIGADGDLVVTLTGQNTVVETSAPDVDISRCGMEVWGDLTLRGTGSLVATGSQCGIYVSGTLAVDGCEVDARAGGAGIADARVAGVIADGLAVRGGGRVVAAGAGSGAGVRAYGVCLLGGAAGGGAAGQLAVDASWLDASGADGGVACLGGSLASARFVCACGRGLWRRRRGGCRRVRGSACGDRARRCHGVGGGDRWSRCAGRWPVRPWHRPCYRRAGYGSVDESHTEARGRD